MTRLDRSGAVSVLGRSGVSARPGAPARVADLMPHPFEAYARVMPPLPIPEGATADDRRWADVLGSRPGPGGLSRAVREHAPDAIVQIGNLDRSTMARLVAVLAPMTSGDCLFHFAGRSFSAFPDHDDDLVYTGPLTSATAFVTADYDFYEAPTTMWPDDGAWCFALWTDAVAAYVGGAAAVVTALVGHGEIEADDVAAEAPIDDWTAP